MKRYIQTISFYTFGNTPEEAFEEAQAQCNRMNKEDDGKRASIDEMCSQEFGQLGSGKVDLEALKNAYDQKYLDEA